MSEHVTDLLGAYLDGELGGVNLRQVENHLSECVACRKELDELRSLSGLLHETVPTESFTSSERFAAKLALVLPRRPEVAPVRKVSEAIWWLLPASAAAIWIFFSTVTTVSTLVTTAGVAGLLGRAAPWLQTSTQQSLWFSASMNLFGRSLVGSNRTLLIILNNANAFWTSLSAELFWNAGIVLLILGWLAAWSNKRRKNEQPFLPQERSHS